ncbi:hypothetical protein HDIA_0114 [Hartmannibacter diazotrophicus]|uniref:YjiS-like domain-containing protein n=1 Tax=Hartmannibacter diazotrophicus TaxID=1482074 RepID=A0A2C9D2G1_9HYPH|nr:DUF1127 domain-containing protein [Hartmannibacter diazotrophicus]SON53655.1 hypothetical protein HDIA_0114 [Hartmannibacter diazotrophicus]
MLRLVASSHEVRRAEQFGVRLLATLRRLWTRYQTHRAMQKTAMRLGELSDAALKDIGLSRSEIEGVARHVSREPTSSSRLHSRPW